VAFCVVSRSLFVVGYLLRDGLEPFSQPSYDLLIQFTPFFAFDGHGASHRVLFPMTLLMLSMPSYCHIPIFLLENRFQSRIYLTSI
jgi:hypothetical protein